MPRPQVSDYSTFAATYIDLVPEPDVLAALQEQAAHTEALLRAVQNPDYRPAPDKWSVRQVVGHMADTERVFGFRALWFARQDPAPLPGFDQDQWMASSDFDLPAYPALVEGFRAARAAHLSMLGQLAPDAWERRGMASGAAFTVRALAYAMLGHERHHLRGLQERYGPAFG
ncbi:DinB family protein [Deinococcus sonorensis]|uniref:DinB family protein n=2 Tax=Deinococcus sonorensis TaxID=309891 RepID=A0AAU7UBK9_9DEIO